MTTAKIENGEIKEHRVPLFLRFSFSQVIWLEAYIFTVNPHPRNMAIRLIQIPIWGGTQ
jgi:hypothetical protein